MPARAVCRRCRPLTESPRTDRVLMPAFNLLRIRDMFGGMVDVVEQMVLKWERCGQLAGSARLPC